MTWIKIGIIVIGALYALLLPYVLYKTIIALQFDPYKYTLSFLSNKDLYEKNIVKGYTWLLVGTAMIHHLYFWLLTEYYFLGQEERYLKIIDYSAAALVLLGVLRHNMLPYSFKTFRAGLRRFSHNVAAAVVFIVLPTLIIIFQSLIIDDYIFLGVGGFVIIGLTIVSLILSAIKGGLNGVTELVFINGLSMWSLFVAAVTVFL